MEVIQSFEDFTAARSDPAFPRSRVRKYLAAHGLRGAKLRAEVDKITSGYIAEKLNRGAVDLPHDTMPQKIQYPYGWPRSVMTRFMKRMFHGYGK